MAGNLRKRLGVVIIATIPVFATTIYFRDGTIFQDFANGSFKLHDGILCGNKETKPYHYNKLDKIVNNSQPIKGLESNLGFVQKTENDSQTHKI